MRLEHVLDRERIAHEGFRIAWQRRPELVRGSSALNIKPLRVDDRAETGS